LTVNPKLLRRGSRRFARRLAFVGALAAVLLVAPSAIGQPSDDTAPVIVPRYFGTAGLNGWYIGDLTLNWDVHDPEGPILEWDPVGCGPFSITVDNPGATRTCWARSAGGTTTIQTKPLKVDKTPPAVSGAPTRTPDANGWYNHALAVAFAGLDLTSGIASASCSPVSGYGGPDNDVAVLTGSCRDNAGNTGVGTFSFKYDATAPSVGNLRAISMNRRAQLTWSVSSDTRVVEIRRTPGRNGEAETMIYRGSVTASVEDVGLTVGRRYHYRVTAFDEASNGVTQSLAMTAAGALFSPAPGATVTAPPTLSWTAVKGVRYYNLQLIRGRKVLSAWPVRPGFQLRRTWIYQGRRYRLRPGLYRWYVWPGKGRLSAGRYGRLLGSSTFLVSE
jgi:hypothetical protein